MPDFSTVIGKSLQFNWTLKRYTAVKFPVTSIEKMDSTGKYCVLKHNDGPSFFTEAEVEALLRGEKVLGWTLIDG